MNFRTYLVPFSARVANVTIPLDVSLSLNESVIHVMDASLSFGQRLRNNSRRPGLKVPSPNDRIASLQTFLHPERFSEDRAEHRERLLQLLFPTLMQSDKSRTLSRSKDANTSTIASVTHSPQPAREICDSFLQFFAIASMPSNERDLQPDNARDSIYFNDESAPRATRATRKHP